MAGDNAGKRTGHDPNESAPAEGSSRPPTGEQTHDEQRDASDAQPRENHARDKHEREDHAAPDPQEGGALLALNRRQPPGAPVPLTRREGASRARQQAPDASL